MDRELVTDAFTVLEPEFGEQVLTIDKVIQPKDWEEAERVFGELNRNGFKQPCIYYDPIDLVSACLMDAYHPQPFTSDPDPVAEFFIRAVAGSCARFIYHSKRCTQTHENMQPVIGDVLFSFVQLRTMHYLARDKKNSKFRIEQRAGSLGGQVGKFMFVHNYRLKEYVALPDERAALEFIKELGEVERVRN